MELVFRSYEPEYPLDRTVREIQKDDNLAILEAFTGVCQIHLGLGKKMPPLDTVLRFQDANRITWAVDDVGIIFAVFDKPGRANVHILFWDKRLRGREGICRGLADWLIVNCGLNYICTQMQATSRSTLAFCQRVGFQEVARDKDGTVHLVYAPQMFHGETPQDGE